MVGFASARRQCGRLVQLASSRSNDIGGKEQRYQRLMRDCAAQTLEDAVLKLESRREPQDLATYAALIRRCGLEKALSYGRRVHAHVCMSHPSGHNTFLGNLLVQMYGKCGSLVDAWSIFKLLPERNLFSWTVMIAAFVQAGQCIQALTLFRSMDLEGVKPNGGTFNYVVIACSKLEALAQGKQVHHRVLLTGFSKDMAVGNSLLMMYAKCGLIDEARKVFDSMFLRNLVTWNSMITAYALLGYFAQALDLFKQMEPTGIQPDRVTYITLLSACSRIGVLDEGREIHSRIPVQAYESDVVLGTALVNMYSKAGSYDGARAVFEQMKTRDVVTWAATIAAYAQNGQGKQAMQLFRAMDQEGVRPNDITFVSVLDACTDIGDISLGRTIHSRITLLGFDESLVAIGNTLLNMYSRHGSLEDAEKLFMSKQDKDVVSWNAMLAAYTRHGHGKQAIKLVRNMDLEGCKPDRVTFLAAFDACGDSNSLAEGRKLHARIRGTKLEQDVKVGNCLVDMYSRCWSLREAEDTYHSMSCFKDLVTWNSIIAAYAMHGLPDVALGTFQELNVEGHQPDDITFTSVLFACSHSGLLGPGLQQFHGLNIDFGVVPSAAHFGCMIDLLARVGRLREAEELIENMPFEPDGTALMTLLGGCRTHSDTDKVAGYADQLFELEPGSSAAYVMLERIWTKFGGSQSLSFH